MENSSWASVVRQYLMAADPHESDEARQLLADLFLDAGDEVTAETVRGRGVSVWATDDRTVEGAYHDGGTPEEASEKFRRIFSSTAEAQAFALGWLSDDVRPGAACFMGKEEVLSFLQGEWDWLHGQYHHDWEDDDGDIEDWEEDEDMDPYDGPYGDDDPHMIELPPADGERGNCPSPDGKEEGNG